MVDKTAFQVYGGMSLKKTNLEKFLILQSFELCVKKIRILKKKSSRKLTKLRSTSPGNHFEEESMEKDISFIFCTLIKKHSARWSRLHFPFRVFAVRKSYPLKKC